MKRTIVAIALVLATSMLAFGDANNQRVIIKSAADFAAENTVLSEGDIALESDTNRMKVGHLGAGFNELGYVTPFVSGGTATISNVVVTSATVTNLVSGGTITANLFSSATFSVNHAACFRTGGQIGFCSTVTSATGTCTCN